MRSRALDPRVSELASTLAFIRIQQSPPEWLARSGELLDSSLHLAMAAGNPMSGPRLRTALMLIAMAIEVQIKALAAPKALSAKSGNPVDWATVTPSELKRARNKRQEELSRTLHHHRLAALADYVGLNPSKADRKVLERLTPLIEWEARYIAPRKPALFPDPRRYRKLWIDAAGTWSRLHRKIQRRPEFNVRAPVPVMARLEKAPKRSRTSARAHAPRAA